MGDSSAIKLLIYAVIVVSAVFHEYAHGWAAYALGDDTAKREGRLSLNPLAHLDPLGTVVIPLFLLFYSGIFIGWAKPVPYNPYALKDQKYGSLKVAAAGPLTNLIIAVFFGLVLRLLKPGFDMPAGFWDFWGFIIYINIFLALFNLLPFPPLDGSKIFEDLFPKFFRWFSGNLGVFGIWFAFLAAIFLLRPLANIVFSIVTGASFY